MEHDTREVGRRVREARLRLPKERRALRRVAGEVGCSVSYLSEVERGVPSKVGGAILRQLAVALGVSLAELTGEEEDSEAALPELPAWLCGELAEKLRRMTEAAQRALASILPKRPRRDSWTRPVTGGLALVDVMWPGRTAEAAG